LTNHAERLIVQINNLDRQRALRAGSQLLNVHLDAAFTGDTGNGRIREGELYAHCCRQTKTHGAETAGVDPTARLVEQVVLGSEHLVLTYVRSYVGIALSHLIQRLNNLLRFD